jgi:hypothetical protein
VAAPPARADQPPPAIRRQIEDFFASQFWDPTSVDWRYANARPFLDGTLWCGDVNYTNSAHIYVGYRHFYVTVYADGVHQGAIMGGRSDDPVGSIAAKVRLLCGF